MFRVQGLGFKVQSLMWRVTRGAVGLVDRPLVEGALHLYLRFGVQGLEDSCLQLRVKKKD